MNQINLVVSDSITHNTEALKKFEEIGFVDNLYSIKQVSNYLHKNKSKLLTNTNPIVKKLSNLIENFKKEQIDKSLIDRIIILKIEIINFGLGLGRTQLRLNANQLNNAISKEIDLKGDPNDPSNKLTYLK